MDRSALARHLLHESQLQKRLEREYLPTGVDAFDIACGGLPRGAVTEIFGPPSSGKTTFLTSFLAHSTAAGEFCTLIDADDSFCPATATSAEADLNRLLWVRCHGVEEALKATDLLVHSGGWGSVALDLSDISPATVRRIPMSWWYRFRRAVENTPTVFVVIDREPFVKTAAAMMLEFPASQPVWSGKHMDFRVLRGLEIDIAPRKPVQARRNGFRANAQR
jgi:hypothetical protein